MAEQASRQPEQDGANRLLAIYDQLHGQPRQDFFAIASEAGLDVQPLHDKDLADAEVQQTADTEKKRQGELSRLIIQKGLEKLMSNPFAYRYGPNFKVTTGSFRGNVQGESVLFRLTKKGDDKTTGAYDSELEIELPYPTPEPFDIKEEKDGLNLRGSEAHRIESFPEIDGYKVLKVGKRVVVRTWSGAGGSQGNYNTEELVLDRDTFLGAGQDTYVAGCQGEYGLSDAVPAFVEILQARSPEASSKDEAVELDSTYLETLADMIDNAQPVQENTERKYLPRIYKYTKGDVELVTIETKPAIAT